MKNIWAKQALTCNGWQNNVLIEIDESGRISSVKPNISDAHSKTSAALGCGVLLPAPANIHSHAFQRAMSGMTERRGRDPGDNFWAWRKLMYKFLDQLTPDDIEMIAAFVQMEMLEAGYAANTEFHYMHHQKDGSPYDNPAELSGRIAAAACKTGIGLTLLPVLYEQGGCDGRPLGPGQIRFGNNIDTFEKLLTAASAFTSKLPPDARLGVAPHSLRAVSREALKDVISLRPKDVVHIHLAEQVGEVEEVLSAYGARPVEWLFEQHKIDQRWCLIHLTQMEPSETIIVAKSKAIAGLCPITEANLGDGIFDAVRYFEHNGRFGVGSDSNIRISFTEELRGLEYSQRLIHRARAVLATEEISNGRLLFDGAVQGGAQASGRNSGVIETGRLADLLALDTKHFDLLGREGDVLLDSFIFAGDKSMISDVWSAGRHLVEEGRHKNHDEITANYRHCIQSLKDRL
ncbi:MAG: formimidoylglutamate deiminase [Maricaulaceae bacterium]